MPCAMPCSQVGDGSGAPKPIRYGARIGQNQGRLVDWGGCVPNPSLQRDGRDPSDSLGRAATGDVRLASASSQYVVEAREQRNVDWFQSAWHPSLRIADRLDQQPDSRRTMLDCDFAIALRSGIRGAKAGVGLSERVAGQHAGLG